MRPIRSFLFTALLLLTESVFAQSARWEPAGGQLSFNQVSELTLIFEDCEPNGGAPDLPQIDGLFLGRPSVSQQSSFSMGFGGSKRSTVYSLTYPVRPTKRVPLHIPPLTVETDHGKITVPAAHYTVGDTTGGGRNTGPSLNDIAAAKLATPKTTVWAGEVFPLTYTLTVTRRYFHSLASTVEWPSAPLLAEDWTKPELNESSVQGERRVVSTQTTRAIAKEPGNFQLKPGTQAVNVIVGITGFSLFQQPVFEPRQLMSEPIDLTVKPLPPPPSGFNGAVGDLKLTSKVVPSKAGLHEPITWTIELSGIANWPDIPGLPSREVSSDFQVVQPEAKRTMKDGALFEGTLSEDVVLVPTKPGSYTLGPVKFTYFDPQAGAYKTLSTEPVTVTVAAVAPSPAPQSGGQPSFTLPSVENPAAPPSLPTPVPPATPENLPRDPIAATSTGHAPLNVRTVAQLAILPSLALVLASWAVLAALRSRAHDPQLPRREAARQLATVLAELRAAGTSPAALGAALRSWQHHTMVLWHVTHAAPGAKLVHAQVGRQSRDAAATWSQLWQEADRVLHGPAAPLPADWTLRAQGALQAVRVPGWNVLTLFAARNLFPFLFAGLVLLAVPGARADAGADAYKRGDFAAAESAWRKSLAATPVSWTGRHNLGLALAQQDHWAEATAHWTSAFLLNPRHPETRWDLTLGLQRSGLAPVELVEFSRGEGRFGVAAWASPAEWQFVLIGSSLALAIAIVLLLLQGYRRLGAWARPTAIVVSLAAIVLAGVATLGLDTYGPLANPNVALVWKSAVLHSIPTEADTTQKTSPLSAGSIAVVDRTFLDGWSRIVFAGGQSGWVRTEDLLRLYR